MKLKTVDNRNEVIVALIVYTLLLVFVFGGLFYQSGKYAILLVFILVESAVVYVVLKSPKTITFFSDSVLVTGMGGKSKEFDRKKDQIELRLAGGSVYISSNTVAVFSKNQKLASFKLNEYEWEFEEFYHTTLSNGYKWKISSDRKHTHTKNYELFLKRKQLMDRS